MNTTVVSDWNNYYIEPYKKKNGKWNFRIRAKNGRIIGHEYNSKQSMMRSAKTLANTYGFPIKEDKS